MPRAKNRQIGSVEDDSRTRGKFHYDMLEVEMPFVSHGVRFSPMVTERYLAGILRANR